MKNQKKAEIVIKKVHKHYIKSLQGEEILWDIYKIYPRKYKVEEAIKILYRYLAALYNQKDESIMGDFIEMTLLDIDTQSTEFHSLYDKIDDKMIDIDNKYENEFDPIFSLIECLKSTIKSFQKILDCYRSTEDSEEFPNIEKVKGFLNPKGKRMKKSK